MPKTEVEDFVVYLRCTLIPDLRKSGSDATADDFEKCCDIIEEQVSRIEVLQCAVETGIRVLEVVK